MSIAYAAAMLLVVAAALGFGEPWLLPLPALLALAYCALLARSESPAGFPSGAPPADRARTRVVATAIRLLAALAAGLLAALSPGGWAVLAVLCVGEAADWLHGWVVRRSAESPFGRAFGEETDAAFILTASLILTVVKDLPDRIAMAASLRYAGILVFALVPPAPLPRAFRRFTFLVRTTPAALLVVAAAPVVTRSATALGDVALSLLAVAFAQEALLRLISMPALARAWGVARSFLIYYAIPGAIGRTSALYGSFVAAGGLAFDVGSHVGSRIAALRRLGARVVAVEPDPAMARIIRRLYARDPEVTVVEAAVADRSGRAVLHRSRANPTVSSIREDWIQAVSSNRRFGSVAWEETAEVEVVTLDDLVRRHGQPDFCKIDIEGGEAAALEGLTAPLRSLSFEYLPATIDVALRCVARLAELGRYRFNVSSVETMRFRLPSWADTETIAAWLRSLPSTGRSGDVYARLEA